MPGQSPCQRAPLSEAPYLIPRIEAATLSYPLTFPTTPHHTTKKQRDTTTTPHHTRESERARSERERDLLPPPPLQRAWSLEGCRTRSGHAFSVLQGSVRSWQSTFAPRSCSSRTSAQARQQHQQFNSERQRDAARTDHRRAQAIAGTHRARQCVSS